MNLETEIGKVVAAGRLAFLLPEQLSVTLTALGKKWIDDLYGPGYKWSSGVILDPPWQSRSYQFDQYSPYYDKHPNGHWKPNPDKGKWNIRVDAYCQTYAEIHCNLSTREVMRFLQDDVSPKARSQRARNRAQADARRALERVAADLEQHDPTNHYGERDAYIEVAARIRRAMNSAIGSDKT